jgi:outer membrane protein TolC
VLTAFQEVETALSTLTVLEREAVVQNLAVTSARRSEELTINQYRAGTVSYLNVLVIQAQTLSNERAALAVQNRRLIASVQLIEALGGGWAGL